MKKTYSRYFVFLASVLLALSIAGATDLQNIESITPQGTQDIFVNGTLNLNNNPLLTTSTLDGVDLDNPGNAITINGNQYAVGSNSIAVNELNTGDVDNRYLNRGSSDSMLGNINMNNNDITGINSLSIRDPGSGEGISFGDQAEIYSAPLDDSNTGGYLQLVNDGGIAFEPGSDGSTAATFTTANNLDMNGNSILYGAICPDGSCSGGNEYFDSGGIHTTAIYDGSGGEIDIQSQINFNGNNIKGIQGDDLDDNTVDNSEIQNSGSFTMGGLTLNGNLDVSGGQINNVDSIDGGGNPIQVNDNLSLGSDNDVCISGANCLSQLSDDAGAADNIFYAYDANGNIDVTGSWTDITFDTEVRENSAYTHATDSAEVTINNNGWYQITGQCYSETTAGRDSARWRLLKDAGSGYSEVSGTRAGSYHRTSANDESTATISTLLNLNSGDKLKMQGYGDSGVFTAPNGCRMRMSVMDNNGAYNDTMWEKAGSDVYYNTGNVGVGTSTPDSQLDIESGNLDMSGNSIDNVNRIGNSNQGKYFDFAESNSYIEAQNSGGGRLEVVTEDTYVNEDGFWLGAENLVNIGAGSGLGGGGTNGLTDQVSLSVNTGNALTINSDSVAVASGSIDDNEIANNVVDNSEIQNGASFTFNGITNNGNLNMQQNVITNLGGGTASINSGDIRFQPASSGGTAGLSFQSNTNSGSDGGWLTWYDDNNNYNYWGDTSENGALVLGTTNDGQGSNSDVTVLKSPAAAVIDAPALRMAGASLNMNNNNINNIGGLQNCGSNQFVNGNGNCQTDTDTTIADNQNLGEVLNQGNTANQDINMNGYNVEGVQSTRFNNIEFGNIGNNEARLAWDNSEGLKFYWNGGWRQVYSQGPTSTSPNHDNLGGVSSGDHHSRYGDGEARNALEAGNVNHIDFSNDFRLNEDGSGNADFRDRTGGRTDIEVGRIYLGNNVGWFDGGGDDIQDNTLDNSEIQNGASFSFGKVTSRQIDGGGTELEISAGEMASNIAGKGGEVVHIAAEGGARIYSSANNADINYTATLVDSSGNSNLPGNLDVAGQLSAGSTNCNGNQFIDGNGNCVTDTDTDNQDLSVGSDPNGGGSTTVDITNGGSATFTDDFEANSDTQDLSISGDTISLDRGGSVTINDANTQLDDEAATSTVNMNDQHMSNLRELELQDWDSDAGGSDNSVRLLRRDDNWMFYNGGFVLGGYSNGALGDIGDGNLLTKGDVNIAGGNLYDGTGTNNFFEVGCNNGDTISNINSAGSSSCQNINHDSIAGVSYNDHHGLGNALTWDANNDPAVGSGGIADNEISDNTVDNTEIQNGDRFTMNGVTLNGELRGQGNSLDLDGNDQGIYIHDSTGNFNIKSGIQDGSDTITAGSGGSEIEMNENGRIELKIDESTSSGNTFSKEAGVTISGGSVSITGGFNGCGSNQFVNGNGNCQTDTTIADNQNLGEVLNQGNVANQAINMNGNSINNANTVSANNVQASNSFQLPTGTDAY